MSPLSKSKRNSCSRRDEITIRKIRSCIIDNKNVTEKMDARSVIQSAREHIDAALEAPANSDISGFIQCAKADIDFAKNRVGHLSPFQSAEIQFLDKGLKNVIEDLKTGFKEVNPTLTIINSDMATVIDDIDVEIGERMFDCLTR